MGFIAYYKYDAEDLVQGTYVGGSVYDEIYSMIFSESMTSCGAV